MDYDKLIKELNEQIDKAQESDSYFITITRKDKKSLYHYRCQMNFNDDDLIPSLDKIKEMVIKQLGGRAGIKKFTFKK